MATHDPVDNAFIKQLWRDVLVEGVRASYGAHRPLDLNAAVYHADELVKRYVDRFEPEYDDTELERVMAEDRARVVAENEAYFEAKKAEHEAERKKFGPWKAGETLTQKSTGRACTVLIEAGKPHVQVQLANGKKLSISRDDLTWPDPNAQGTEAPATPDAETNGAPPRHLEAVQ
jgi:hypothetical protein